MTEDDRRHWDARYADHTPVTASEVTVGLPLEFSAAKDLLPPAGQALDLACGRGLVALVLAQRGLVVTGYDISPEAIALAEAAAKNLGLTSRCTFGVVDLDTGIPATRRGVGSATRQEFDVVVCSRFWDEGIAAELPRRIRRGGVVMASALSEVGNRPGRFRLQSGTLRRVFEGDFDTVDFGEEDGLTWYVGIR